MERDVAADSRKQRPNYEEKKSLNTEILTVLDYVRMIEKQDTVPRCSTPIKVAVVSQLW